MRRFNVSLNVDAVENGETTSLIEFELGGVTLERARAAILLLLDETDPPPDLRRNVVAADVFRATPGDVKR